MLSMHLNHRSGRVHECKIVVVFQCGDGNVRGHVVALGGGCGLRDGGGRRRGGRGRPVRGGAAGEGVLRLRERQLRRALQDHPGEKNEATCKSVHFNALFPCSLGTLTTSTTGRCRTCGTGRTTRRPSPSGGGRSVSE